MEQADKGSENIQKEDTPMREGMKDMLQQIRAKAPTVPFILETATIMMTEVDQAKKTFNLVNLLIIHSTPVLDQHMFINIKQSDQSHGFAGKPPYGLENSKEQRQLGLLDLLMPILIKPLVKMLTEEAQQKKKVLVFCRDKETLSSIDSVRKLINVKNLRREGSQY